MNPRAVRVAKHIGEQGKLFPPWARTPPNKGNSARRMFSRKRACLDMCVVKDARLHRHFRDHRYTKAIFNHLDKRVQ